MAIDKLIKKNKSKKKNIGIIFDEKEREKYLGNFYGAKKRRSEHGKEMEKEKLKEAKR